MEPEVMTTAAVAIGRNEGARLVACLASLKGQVDHIVYVDSGSTDGSVEAARAAGADVVALDMSVPFTAARARNEGFARALQIAPDVTFVQFIDGDCDMEPDWIATGRAALENDPGLAVVCGWRAEKCPEATLWNQLIDAEWHSGSPGLVDTCGGDALMRVSAVAQVGGYRADLIAGEEPEMCFRMRAKGWRIALLDAPMTRHDADLTRIGQWWQRARRTGHTYAQGLSLYRDSPVQYKRRELQRTLLWGGVLPALIILSAFVWPLWAVLLGLVYPLQLVRMHLRGTPLNRAFFLVFGKFPEMQGAVEYWLFDRKTLIEYK